MSIHHDLSHAVLIGGTAFDRQGVSPFARFRDFFKRVHSKKAIVPKPDDSTICITSPLSGTVRALDQIEDPIFSSEALGKGCAIEPAVGEVYAPFSGTVSQLAETHHAIGVTGENGVELLIHVGMDTIELGGQFFEPLVRMGDHVAQGQLLLRFDMESIKNEGYSLVTPVVVTNMDHYVGLNVLCFGRSTIAQALLEIIPESKL